MRDAVHLLGVSLILIGFLTITFIVMNVFVLHDRAAHLGPVSSNQVSITDARMHQSKHPFVISR